MASVPVVGVHIGCATTDLERLAFWATRNEVPATPCFDAQESYFPVASASDGNVTVSVGHRHRGNRKEQKECGCN